MVYFRSMKLHQDIKEQIKDAMKARNTILLETLRSIVTACTNELVSKGKKPQEFLSDTEVIAVITRLSKQRKDSIEQYKKAGREDLVKEEQEQLSIFETFLPKLMNSSDVEVIARVKKDELGITDASKKGLLMSALMKELKGKADGTVVKEVVDALF